MSKQAADPITEKDLREYLESKDDFAFEREVYHIANGLGLRTEHAGLYEDPITNKPRQFDIRAAGTLQAQRIELAIECKGLSRAFPLLVSCVPRARHEANHQFLYSDAVMGLGASFTRVATFAGGRPPLLYAPGQPVGKSMKHVRRDSRGEITSGDEVFDKWMQSLASVCELIQQGAHLLSTNTERVKQVAFIPVLVVTDGTLWVADYSHRGELTRDPFVLDELTFYLGRKYQLKQEKLRIAITHLHIFTRSAVGPFLENLARGGGIWQQLFG